MPYKTYILCYALESVYATSPIVDANSGASLIGITSRRANLPDPVARVELLPPSLTSPEVQGIIKTLYRLPSSFAIGLQHGIPIYLIMGKSSTVGSTPPYTHTITCPSMSSGIMSELPSVTLHSEAKGEGVSNFVRQYTGMKMTRAYLSCSAEQKYLILDTDWVGSYAERKTFVLTNPPTLPDETITGKKPYLWGSTTRKFNSVDQDNLTGWRLTIDNEIEEVSNLRLAGDGTDMSQWIPMLLDGSTKKYLLELDFVADDYVFWDELVSLVNTKTFEVLFTRAVSNTLKMTCTNCTVAEAPHPLPFDPKDKKLRGTAVIYPQSVSFEVVDSIGKTYYGE